MGMNDKNLIVKENKRVSKIKRSLLKYQEDLFNYQRSVVREVPTPKELEELNPNREFVTVEELSEEDEKFEAQPAEKNVAPTVKDSTKTGGANAQAKGLMIFSHSYLNEQKTHLKHLEHPQGSYNLMKIRK